MKKYSYLFKCLILFFFIQSCNNKNEDYWDITSPDKKIKITIKKELDSILSKLNYTVSYKENESYKTIIKPSRLGIESDENKFVEDLKFIKSKSLYKQDIKYSMKSGSKNIYTNQYNELNLSFKNNKNNTINIIFRAFNNGVAFCYNFPKNTKDTIKITKEHSSFKLGFGNFFGHPYDTITKFSPAYETYYKTSNKIGTNAPKDKNGWAFPLLFETQDHWVLISETGFDGSYGASHLQQDSKDGDYKLKFAEAKEARGFYDNTSTIETSKNTPWRFITISNDLANIVESHMVTDLSEPSLIKNTNWIKPGRSTWSWWSESDSPQNYNALLPYIDLASKMGWEYSLIDANWNKMQSGSLKKLITYAKKQKVGLLIWYNSGGKHNIITEEPRNIINNRKIRIKEFERISRLGIKGIKVDFFQSDKQEIIKQYIEILEDAANYHLLVNFHGCTLPKGWRKTYPNLLTMEAIKGAENYKFDSSYPKKAPSHIATIPFLRGIVGPTDYTPLTFSDSKFPHLTTNAFELALPIIIESGLIHFSENYKILKKQPKFIIEFLKGLPATWDEIKYIAGYPGKDAIIARKKGKRWFIGGINGENKHKSFALDMSILGIENSGITIITDNETTRNLGLKKSIINNEKLYIEMLPFGGFVGLIN